MYVRVAAVAHNALIIMGFRIVLECYMVYEFNIYSNDEFNLF